MKIDVVRLKPVYRRLKVEHTFTRTQLKYIDLIEKYKFYFKKVPSIRTICKIVEVNSPATTKYMLDRLKEKGYDYEEL